MGCFPVDFQEVKRPLRTKSVKRPIKVWKRPINEGKRPIKAKVLVGVSVGCLMGCFRAPSPWRKTDPLKRPIKRSMTKVRWRNWNRIRFDHNIPEIRLHEALTSTFPCLLVVSRRFRWDVALAPGVPHAKEGVSHPSFSPWNTQNPIYTFVIPKNLGRVTIMAK